MLLQGRSIVLKVVFLGYVIDSSQEFIAIGTCNVVGSFFSSFPITGVYTNNGLFVFIAFLLYSSFGLCCREPHLLRFF